MNEELIKLRHEVEGQSEVINKLKEQYEESTSELMK
jgi:hypothetical protein